jgi:2,5-diketo-D-gluconate reductase A
VVVEVARQAGKAPAQALLRWGLQPGLVVRPRSTTPGRTLENAALFGFELDAGSMGRVDALEEGLATGWDPRQQP